MSRLSNGWKIPTDIAEMKEMKASFEKTIHEMESENPLTIFREHMESGLLFKAGLQDALNQVNTFANLYISASELQEAINLAESKK
ncbi:hypothetical protein EHQ58_03080 [Leptospira ognonensis]|uniref:Uncharacterized protein n=1 Tax=Leptospira ognonensis TaxID=2484945 RepID=A0A4R9K949_9LEPT|nr:hypothetical protein [Leptospira ognonensis]TGL62202.1 hypothetical protein EHQ58_03080 [Leptospira ognonensis]